ncbi:hypothetical protein DFH94DRAFT_848248 [Russula ochroleuca]|uniref:Uncharacterized protein n=1 Tax=Russula ochroleuca TaxID=152965 RepID=A0A9P5MQ51_9AGAM|nr:hypothetical protein DFH94DRAFT_848248 [Russula ochroleuca]
MSPLLERRGTESSSRNGGFIDFRDPNPPPCAFAGIPYTKGTAVSRGDAWPIRIVAANRQHGDARCTPLTGQDNECRVAAIGGKGSGSGGHTQQLSAASSPTDELTHPASLSLPRSEEASAEGLVVEHGGGSLAALAMAAAQTAVHRTQTHPPTDWTVRSSSATAFLVTSVYVTAHHPSHLQPQALAKIAQQQQPLKERKRKLDQHGSSQNQNDLEGYVDEGSDSEDEEHSDQIGAVNKNFIAQIHRVTLWPDLRGPYILAIKQQEGRVCAVYKGMPVGGSLRNEQMKVFGNGLGEGGQAWLLGSIDFDLTISLLDAHSEFV